MCLFKIGIKQFGEQAKRQFLMVLFSCENYDGFNLKGEGVKQGKRIGTLFKKFSLIIGGRYSTIFTALLYVSAQSKAALVGEIAVPCTRNPLQRG